MQGRKPSLCVAMLLKCLWLVYAFILFVIHQFKGYFYPSKGIKLIQRCNEKKTHIVYRGIFNVVLHIPYEVVLVMNALAMTCSACNPLLYTLFSKKFRAKITSLLSCDKTKKRTITARTCEITYSFSKVSLYIKIF